MTAGLRVERGILIKWLFSKNKRMGVAIYLGLVGAGLVTAVVLTKVLKGINLI